MKEVNSLSFTTVDDFIDTRIRQGFTKEEILEEMEDYLNDY